MMSKTRTFEDIHPLWGNDPVVVPRRFYRSLPDYQIVYGGGQINDVPAGDWPCVLRGALHCRVWKRGGHRHYAREVCERFIRRARVTQVDPDAWQTWLNKTLFPLARKKSWWWRQRAATTEIIQMVSQWSMVIDGEWHSCYEQELRRNVVALYRAYGRLA
jgi:hypothetical protein